MRFDPALRAGGYMLFLGGETGKRCQALTVLWCLPARTRTQIRSRTRTPNPNPDPNPNPGPAPEPEPEPGITFHPSLQRRDVFFPRPSLDHGEDAMRTRF